MSTAKRRQHNAGFKAKVAMDALKDEETVCTLLGVHRSGLYRDHSDKEVSSGTTSFAILDGMSRFVKQETKLGGKCRLILLKICPCNGVHLTQGTSRRNFRLRASFP